MLEHYKKLSGISLNNVKVSLHSRSAELLSLKPNNKTKARKSFSPRLKKKKSASN